MQFWTLWKLGPDREPDGALAAHLVACTDSFDTLARRGAHLAALFGDDRARIAEWIESPRGSRRYQLGTERDGAYMVIEPDIAPETNWELATAAPLQEFDPWLDEELHSLR